MTSHPPARSPDLSGNPRRFILFTLFYNARAYYPVLAILFLDLGLTLDQFVLLNLTWAATIFVFEVPSGALADTLGRKKLLVAASSLMVVEMLCLLLAPQNGGPWLFALCIANRFLSGLSEAFASGADEALAYDSLAPADRENSWDRVLATAMRWRSAGYVVAMILGGLLYDPSAIQHILPPSWQVPASLAHRLPVILVLIQALVCLAITLRMVEPPNSSQPASNTFLHAVSLTLRTARWAFSHRSTLIVIVVGMFLDSICRNFATLTSSYYRLIDLPEWSFGIIGAAIGALGWFVPALAKNLNQRFSTLSNLALAATAIAIGLAAVSRSWPLFGLLPAMLLMTTLGFLSFTVSRALHRESTSSNRATVLSVKGLAFNLGYGVFSLAFSRLLASFPDHPPGAALRQALFWQTPAFALAAIVLLSWAKRQQSTRSS